MSHEIPKDVIWRKAQRSVGQGACVELAKLSHDTFAIRDSKNPDQPPLIFNAHEFSAFLSGARSGEFNDLINA